jgi:hypothetical protein
MDKENVTYTMELYSVIKKEQNYVICKKMDYSRNHHVGKISQSQDNCHVFSLIYSILIWKKDESRAYLRRGKTSVGDEREEKKGQWGEVSIITVYYINTWKCYD